MTCVLKSTMLNLTRALDFLARDSSKIACNCFSFQDDAAIEDCVKKIALPIREVRETNDLLFMLA